MMTEKDIETRCEFYFGKMGYKFDWSIKINGRLSKTWGRCIYSMYQPRLEFSRKMLENCTDDFIDNVIAHECAHALVWLETHTVHHHDEVFKHICDLLGTTHNTAKHAGEYKEGIIEDNLHKYIVWCDDCGATWFYDRKGKIIKDLDWCSCPHCKTMNLKYKQNW